MSEWTEKELLLDSSVLINFLRVDRCDLLGQLPSPLFVTNHVRDEITLDYPDQLTCLLCAIDAGHLSEIIVDDPAEVSEFLNLSTMGIGSGECSAIAAASTRGWQLAIEDKKASRVALIRFPTLRLLKTQDLMVQLLYDNVLSLEDADVLLEEWRLHHRFRLKIASFRELLHDP